MTPINQTKSPQAVDLERHESVQERISLLPNTSLNGTTFHAGVDLPWYRRPLYVAAAGNLGLILLWYFFGTFLSLWNKILLSKEHGLFGNGAFPAPFMMSSLQFFAQHFIARSLLASGLVKRRGEEQYTWKQYAKTIVPNGIATGLDIGFSNYSLVFITLSFYVMCKSTTPLFLLTFAIIWGIEKPSWSLAAVVSVIVCGLLLLVAGETQFHLVGFILVMTASALSGLRWTITQVLLQGNKHHASHGGPVEVMYQLTPIMGITLAIVSLSFEKLWSTLPTSPYFSTLGHACITTLILFTGGVIAFCMVWAEFTLIANTSALTFMVAGTFKEIVTVGAAVVFLHERFTIINALGLVVLVLGVVLFNYLKYQKLKQGEVRPLILEDEDFRANSPGHRSGNHTSSSNNNSNSNSPLRGDHGQTLYAMKSTNTFHVPTETAAASNGIYSTDGSIPRPSSAVEMVGTVPASPSALRSVTEASHRRPSNTGNSNSATVNGRAIPVFVVQDDEGGGSAKNVWNSSEHEILMRRQRSI